MPSAVCRIIIFAKLDPIIWPVDKLLGLLAFAVCPDNRVCKDE
jgi:hypothetical protein